MAARVAPLAQHLQRLPLLQLILYTAHLPPHPENFRVYCMQTAEALPYGLPHCQHCMATPTWLCIAVQQSSVLLSHTKSASCQSLLQRTRFASLQLFCIVRYRITADIHDLQKCPIMYILLYAVLLVVGMFQEMRWCMLAADLVMGQLGDVKQRLEAIWQLHKCAVIHQPNHPYLVHNPLLQNKCVVDSVSPWL